MEQPPRQMRLGVFVQTPGHHVGGWRHPDADARTPNLALMQHIAATAEAAKFDMFFLGDGFATGYGEHPSTIGKFEPLGLLSALAMGTTRLGLAATASTTYAEPYPRGPRLRLAGSSLWWACGLERRDHGLFEIERRVRPHASAACRALCDGGGIRRELAACCGTAGTTMPSSPDKAAGLFVRPGSLHVPTFEGKYFSIQGALNVPRSPQGHPVLIQAGSSGPGRALAARIADVVFTAQNDLTEAQAFYKSVKAQLAANGRASHAGLVMPGVMPVVGRTEREAQDIFAELNRNIDTAQAFTVLSERLGADMSVHPLDGPVPDVPETEHLKSRAALLIQMARRENLTLRQLFHRVAAARGHLLPIGTPLQVADVLERWFREGGADGFNIMPPFFPGQFDAFAQTVVPILQERGLFRADYTGATLRDHLGLERPADRRGQ